MKKKLITSSCVELDLQPFCFLEYDFARHEVLDL